MRWLNFVIASGLTALSLTVAAPAALADCLLPDAMHSDGPSGYHERDGRCEGLYTLPVAAPTGLSVIGFLSDIPDYDTSDPDSPLVLSARGNALPHMFAVTARDAAVQYRMDTVSIDADGRFAWPPDIALGQLRLPPDQLAAIACTPRCQFDLAEPVVIAPIAVRQGDQAERFEPPLLIVRTQGSLKELRGILTNLATDATRQVPFSQAFFAPSEAIDLWLTMLDEPGTYQLHLIGTERDGRSITLAVILDIGPEALP